MGSAVRAGFLYFALVFAAGFALGTLRAFLLSPVLGETFAVLLELPAILIISWIASRDTISRLGVPREVPTGAAMGAVAFALLIVADALVDKALVGRGLAEHFRAYEFAPGQLGLGAQILFALFPTLQMLWAGSRRR